MPDQRPVPLRDDRGRLLPGHYPPGAGRKKGSSQADLVRKLIEPHRQQLIDRALDLTKSEDPFAAANALRICLERLAPAPKQEAEKIVVPGMAEAATFTEKCRAVVTAVAHGEISTEAAERALKLLDIFRRCEEADAMAPRLAAVEALLKITPPPVVIDLPVDDGSDLV